MQTIFIVIGVTGIMALNATCFFLGLSIGRMLEARRALRKIKRLQRELTELQDFRNIACQTYTNEPN